MDSVIAYIFENDDSIRSKIEPISGTNLEEDLGLIELETSLLNQLNKEQQILFEDILSLHSSINDEYMTSAFQKGMAFGIKLMIEVFNSEI